MSTRLIEIPADAFAREVLPLSAKLWAGRRDLATYQRQTTEVARSPYGRANYATFGFEVDGMRVASCKRYLRTIRFGTKQLRAAGIGAVFTPEDYRGCGYASAMLATLLDERRAAGDDVAYLFSDIRPQFYGAIGFVELPSRAISLRADALPTTRVAVERLEAKDWPAVQRTFAAREAERPWGFERNAQVWNWVRLRIKHGSEHTAGSETNLVIRRGRTLAGYVIGVRAPEHDAYIVDEFGWGDRDEDVVAPLLRAAAGDLRRIVGWLPPDRARELLPRGAVRKRKDAIFMAAPLTKAGKAWLDAAHASSSADGVWATDHV
ncbi:MAG TPA: GNAT family N-acetyltransferase [Candidatus Baltobacteraceae bacterium]|jgi:predicted N-acetyltransferase YhbS